MKKVIFAIAIVASFTACNDTATQTANSADSATSKKDTTVGAKVDTAASKIAAKTDTAASKVAAKTDTAAKKVAETIKAKIK